MIGFCSNCVPAPLLVASKISRVGERSLDPLMPNAVVLISANFWKITSFYCLSGDSSLLGLTATERGYPYLPSMGKIVVCSSVFYQVYWIMLLLLGLKTSVVVWWIPKFSFLKALILYGLMFFCKLSITLANCCF